MTNGNQDRAKRPDKYIIAHKRNFAGLTQTQAAELVYSTLRTWQRWESGEVKMHQAIWELFEIKIRELTNG